MSAIPTDGELAIAARAGDGTAFTELYDRYFQRVYDYLTRLTRNRDDAAELTQDTFLRAMNNLGQLRDPERFRSWLFSIARSQGLNGIERRKRSVPVSPTPEDDAMSNPILTAPATDPALDPELVAVHNEMSELVWEAAESLDERTYTVFDLTVRHGMDSAEIADVMGVSAGAGYTMVNRMKSRVGESIGTYLLMRKGSRDCEQLAEIVAAAQIPPVSRSARRTVDRHVRDCDTCERTKKALVAPSKVFGAFAMVAAPAGLQAQIRRQIQAEWVPPPPPPGGGGPGWRRGVLAAAAVVVVLILAVLAGWRFATESSLEADSVATADDSAPAAAPAPSSPEEAAAPAPTEPGEAAAAPTLTATPVSSPDGSAFTEPTASADPVPPPLAPEPQSPPAAPPADPTPPPLAPEPQSPPSPAPLPPPEPPVADPPPPPPPAPPPTISLVQPAVGTRATGTRLENPPPVWYANLSLFASVASDNYDNSQLTVTWTSSVDGTLGTGIALLAELSAPCANSNGTSHLVTGTVTDPDGLQASASVTVIVDPDLCPAG
jgi:RNA polymerase sigma factor (sigma-70 family)